MKAEIVSIGTELLLGEIVDTNSNHIARTLRDIGVNLFYMTSVGDNLQRITDALKLSLSRSDLIITTGGLGPTVDDVTRQGVAEATGRPLEFRQDLYEQIQAHFARFGTKMSENNRQQAYVPQGAIAIENPVGTAPCYIVETPQGTIISLPGVPREMKYILSQRVIPYLQDKMGGPSIIKALVLRTAGIGESYLDEQIADLMTHANPTVGLAAHSGQTDIRITARADSTEEANRMIEDMEAIVRQRVGDFIYATGSTRIEKVIVERLQEAGQKLAVWEAGTDGALQKRIEAMENGKDVLTHSRNYPSFDELCAALPNLDTEPNLDKVVEQVAKQLLEDSQAKVAIVIATRSNGTAIAVAGGDRVRRRSYGYGGEETQAHQWVAGWGLSMAWRLLNGGQEG